MNVRSAIASFLFVGATVSSGCGRPQVEPENLHLIASLRTALSTRNVEWLEENARIIDERRASGKMSDTEYAEFQAILDDARAGDWAKAEQDALAFQKAQRPTDDQIAQVRQHWR